MTCLALCVCLVRLPPHLACRGGTGFSEAASAVGDADVNTTDAERAALRANATKEALNQARQLRTDLVGLVSNFATAASAERFTHSAKCCNPCFNFCWRLHTGFVRSRAASLSKLLSGPMSRPEAVQASTASGTSATSLLAPGTAEAVLSAAANMIAQGNQKVLNAATDESALLYKRRELQAHARELYERELQTITAQAATSLAMKRADDLMAVAKNLAAILTERLMDGEYLSFSSANAAMHVSREPYCPELGKTYLSPLKRTPSLTSTGLFASFDMPST